MMVFKPPASTPWQSLHFLKCYLLIEFKKKRGYFSNSPHTEGEDLSFGPATQLTPQLTQFCFQLSGVLISSHALRPCLCQ